MKRQLLGAMTILMAAMPYSAAQEAMLSCRNLPPQQQNSIWWGRFSGGRESNRGFDDGGIEIFTDEQCFTARRACERWLYELKSEYGYFPQWNECRQGYAPGAPVKRW
jgi:hypothetical protein